MGLGDIAQGGLGGAATGAAFGPGGALVGGGIGALLGGLGGMFGAGQNQPGSQQRDMLLGLASEAGRRGAPQQSQLSGFRDDQKDLIARLKALANGQGPSLATEMLRKQNETNTQNQVAMAGGARGNPALAARQAQNNAAGMANASNAQAAQARIAEQLGALQQLGLTSYGARGQDEANSQFNSNLLLRGLQGNDATRIGAITGSMQGEQMAAQAPSWGDYLMGSGGALGQILSLARGGKQTAPAPSGI